MARPRKKAPTVKNYQSDLQDALTKRIEECQSVLDHLESCPAFKVINRDLEMQKKVIDDNWQNLPDGDPKLRELRITKLAYNHLLNLKESYQLDLETSQKELYKLQNTDKVIIKDFDDGV